MTPHNDPIFSLTKLKGYWYQQMCHTSVDIASTMSVYPAQSPRFIATYLKGALDPSVGSFSNNPNKPSRDKAIKAHKVAK